MVMDHLEEASEGTVVVVDSTLVAVAAIAMEAAHTCSAHVDHVQMETRPRQGSLIVEYDRIWEDMLGETSEQLPLCLVFLDLVVSAFAKQPCRCEISYLQTCMHHSHLGYCRDSDVRSMEYPEGVVLRVLARLRIAASRVQDMDSNVEERDPGGVAAGAQCSRVADVAGAEEEEDPAGRDVNDAMRNKIVSTCLSLLVRSTETTIDIKQIAMRCFE